MVAEQHVAYVILLTILIVNAQVILALTGADARRVSIATRVTVRKAMEEQTVRLLQTAVHARVVRALMGPHVIMVTLATHISVIVQLAMMELPVDKFARTIIVMTTVRSSHTSAIHLYL